METEALLRAFDRASFKWALVFRVPRPPCSQVLTPAARAVDRNGTAEMIRGPVLALVPARGGSRGIIGKNLARIDGSPLLSITLSTLVSVPQVDRLVVSTDDLAIAAVASLHRAEIITVARTESGGGQRKSALGDQVPDVQG